MAPACIPLLEIDGPSGRVVIAPRSADDRVGDLADAIGLDPGLPLDLDGRTVDRHLTLERAGVVRGSRLRPSAPGPAAAGDPVVVVTCDAGPAAGGTFPLGPGRHVVGRAVVAVRLADPGVEAHHLLLDVDPGGSVTVVQVAGRVPCRLDGEPMGGRATLVDSGVVTLGSSRIRVERAGGPEPAKAVLGAVEGDPWRRTLRRTPRVVPRWEPVPVTVPAGTSVASGAGAAGLIAAVLAAVGAIVVAVVMGSPVFLVFAGVGLAASIGMWAVSRIGATRQGRRHAAGHRRELATFDVAIDAQRDARMRHHATTTPGVAVAVGAATAFRADVWSRRPGHDDVHRASIGWGPVEWEVALDGDASGHGGAAAAVVARAGLFPDAAVPVDLGPGAALAIDGPGGAGVARAVVVQLATWTGPADLRVAVVASHREAWDWCRWLPHTGPGGCRVVSADDTRAVAAVLAGLDDGGRHHVVVVTDRADLLSQRTGPLRRFLGTAHRAAVIAVVEPDGSPPAMCRSVLEIGSVGSARWRADASVDAHPVTVHAAGVTVATATTVARALAGLLDPEEEPSGAGAGSVAAVTMGELAERYGPGPIDDPIAIAAAWAAGGADPAPVATLGLTGDGVVAIDLARDGPHALVAGTTGAGKSELLRTLVASMAARCSPAHVTFVLIDYKGGSTFDACADLPHTVGLVTDLDGPLAERALTSLDAEVRRREQVLRSAGATDLAGLRAGGGTPLARLVVVVDEFATLAVELPDFLHALVGVAQRGRSLGVHLVLATQRPAGVVDDDIRANTDLRIALRLHDVADARDVVGDDGPVSFPRGVPGRAMLRLGADEHVVFQAARSTGPALPDHDERLHVVGDVTRADSDETELTVLVHSIRNAAALADVGAAHRPWLPPLPAVLERVDLGLPHPPDGVVGLLDDPAGQRRVPLRWTPADGNLAIVGAVGSGTTAALRSVLVATATARSSGACHLYVVDARGDDRLDGLRRLGQCGAVVRVHERERLSRLLRRLTAELDARLAGGGQARRHAVVLAIDGLPALRTVLDDPLERDALDRLGRVIAEGAGVGVVTVLTAERPGAVPAAVLSTCADRWVGRLDDPAEATLCGLPAGRAVSGGPGRFVVASSRLEAQLVELDPELAGAVTGRTSAGPGPIDVLPGSVVTPCRGAVGASGDLELTIGRDFESLGDAVVRIPDGEHLLVAGPARSGRSNALAALAAAWRGARPTGIVRVVAPRGDRRWPAAEVADVGAALATVETAGAAVLLVVDDAERVDDPRLGRLAGERRPGVLLAAAGRPDALRGVYGHWTTVVRRSRLGLLLSACADVDGDLLGELLPRRPPIAPRPGLAWVIDASGRRLTQLSS